jgi:Ca2+-binding RTX toxin-like protein
LKRLIALMPVLVAVALAVASPTLAQVPVTMVDCMTGDPCIGTPGNDTINGSERQDIIYGLEGDDTIDPGNDAVTDYIYCGPGFDTVNQMPRVIPDDLQHQQGALQYASEPDVIADDCEARAL